MHNIQSRENQFDKMTHVYHWRTSNILYGFINSSNVVISADPTISLRPVRHPKPIPNIAWIDKPVQNSELSPTNLFDTAVLLF